MYKKIVIHVQNCCLAYETYRYQTFSLPSRGWILKTLQDPTTQPLDENVKDNKAQIRIHTKKTNKQRNNRFNKQKTTTATTSQVHHTFCFISLPFIHDFDVKMPNFAFYE